LQERTQAATKKRQEKRPDSVEQDAKKFPKKPIFINSRLIAATKANAKKSKAQER
jgi:hypothetical protein